MQNEVLLEQLAAQRRAERQAEAEHERLAAAARSASGVPTIRCELATMAAAFVCWCVARLATVGRQVSKRRESCPDCP